VIIAIPQQRTGWAYPMGGPPGMDRTPYKVTTTWHRWWCSTCRVWSAPGSLWGMLGALESGEYHEEIAQCQVIGQLDLFSVGGAR
jgi:hypothetical protein